MSVSLPKIFYKLSEHERSLVQAKLAMRTYQAGEVIFRQDEPGDEIFFIYQGCVKVTRTSEEGRELLITYLKADDFFGELSVLTGALRTADTIAVGQVEVAVLSSEHFAGFLSSAEFSRFFMTALAWRLHDSSERLSDLVLYNIYRNVLETLRGLAEPKITGGEMVLTIEARPTHQEIAALVGSSREVITRTLRHLQLDGKIKIEGKRVFIF